MLPCLLAHASPRVALSGVPVCTGAHPRGGGVRVPAVFCPPAGLDLPRLGPSASPGAYVYTRMCVGRGCRRRCYQKAMVGMSYQLELVDGRALVPNPQLRRIPWFGAGNCAATVS